MFRRQYERANEPLAARPSYAASGWDVPPSFNFPQDVVDVLARDPIRPALIDGASDGTVDLRTFADTARETTRWTRLYAEHGLEVGDRVALALEPGTPWAAAILAALRFGVLPVSLGTQLTPKGLAARLVQIDPALVVVDHRSEPVAEAAAALWRHQPTVLTLAEAEWSLLRVAEATPRFDRPATSPALIAFTAGRSVQRPRPVVHTHAATFAAYVSAQEWLGASSGDLVLCGTDSGSASTLWLGLFGPLATGAAVMHLDPSLEDDERIEILSRYQPTIVVQPPREHRRFLDLLESNDLTLGRLRNAVSCDEPLEVDLQRRFRAVTGVPLLNGLITTETGPIVYQPFGSNAQVGSVGLAAPGHVVSPVDADGYAAPVGVIGDLAVYGSPPSLCLGYWDGGAPSDAMADDVWTLTGDRASYDQEGSLWLDESASSDDRAGESVEGAAPTGAASVARSLLVGGRPEHASKQA